MGFFPFWTRKHVDETWLAGESPKNGAFSGSAVSGGFSSQPCLIPRGYLPISGTSSWVAVPGEASQEDSQEGGASSQGERRGGTHLQEAARICLSFFLICFYSTFFLILTIFFFTGWIVWKNIGLKSYLIHSKAGREIWRRLRAAGADLMEAVQPISQRIEPWNQEDQEG